LFCANLNVVTQQLTSDHCRSRRDQLTTLQIHFFPTDRHPVDTRN